MCFFYYLYIAESQAQPYSHMMHSITVPAPVQAALQPSSITSPSAHAVSVCLF